MTTNLSHKETAQALNDALKASREGNAQYLLSDGSRLIRCEFSPKLLEYLKSGNWDYEGKCINGSLHETYFVKDETDLGRSEINAILRFISDVGGFSVPSDVSALLMYFSLLYDKDGNLEETRFHVSGFYSSLEQADFKCDMKGDKAEKILSFIKEKTLILLYNEGLLTLLEKTFGEGVSCK